MFTAGTRSFLSSSSESPRAASNSGNVYTEVSNTPSSSRSSLIQLDFQRNLCGREDELTRLDAFWEQREDASQILMVHGMSGSGKTALVTEWMERLQQTTSLCILQGKFDQLQDMSIPYSAIMQAFDQMGHEILQSVQNLHEDWDDEESATFKRIKLLREALQHEGGALAEVIPSFEGLVAIDSSKLAADVAGKKKQAGLSVDPDRLALVFLSFLESFCTPESPMILFLDDLQWADSASFDLLVTLLGQNKLKHFVLVGAYRDEASEEVHKRFLQRLQEESSPITHLRVLNLQLPHVNQMIAKAMSARPEQSLPLAEEICRKTHGNPFFALKFLEMLQRKGILTFSFSRVQWVWEIDRIRAETNVSENVAQVVSLQIESLKPALRRILKLASFTGFVFYLDLLEKLETLDVPTDIGLEPYDFDGTELSRNGEQLDERGEPVVDQTARSRLLQRRLEQIKDEGLIERAPRKGSYKFSHDRIQQCVYEMIPESSRDLLHLCIGRLIQREFLSDNTATDYDRFLFLAADQLNKSVSFVETEEERHSLMQLNLEASRLAESKSDTNLVANFLQKALRLVSNVDWGLSYELLVELYSRSAEIESSCGRLERARELVRIIEENAKCSDDTIRGQIVKMQACGVQCDFDGAIKIASKILVLLDEPLPRGNVLNVIRAFRRADRLAKGKSDQYFVDLAPITDPRKRWAMKVLQAASTYAWNSGDTALAGVCFLSTFSVAMRHGSCRTTAWAFGSYGLMLASIGRHEEAFRFGQLAIQKMEKPAPGPICLAYVFLSHLKKPAALSLEPLLSAYRTGVRTGETEFGSICFCAYADLYMFCGLPLGPFIKDMHNFGRQLKLCNQDLALAFVLPLLQLASNLTGETEDPVTVSWQSCSKLDIFSENVTLYKESLAVLTLLYAQMLNAYVLGELTVARRALDALDKMKVRRLTGTHFANYFFVAMDGLVGFTAYRQTGQPRYRRLGNKSIRELKKLSKDLTASNALGLLLLLKAERASFKAKLAKGKALYDTALSQLARCGFVHFTALAYERAGEFMNRHGDYYWTKHYMSCASTQYDKWGASVKVASMRRSTVCGGRLSFNDDDDDDDVAHIPVRGKEQYDETKDSLAQRSNPPAHA